MEPEGRNKGLAVLRIILAAYVLVTLGYVIYMTVSWLNGVYPYRDFIASMVSVLVTYIIIRFLYPVLRRLVSGQARGQRNLKR